MRVFFVIFATVVGFTLAGCGSTDDDRSQLRPPAVLGISGFVGNGKILIDPQEFGAGPISLVVTNQTDQGLVLSIEGRRVEQELAIGPRGTLKRKFTLAPGEYVMSSDRADLKSAAFTVGPERASAQHELLQP